MLWTSSAWQSLIPISSGNERHGCQQHSEAFQFRQVGCPHASTTLGPCPLGYNPRRKKGSGLQARCKCKQSFWRLEKPSGKGRNWSLLRLLTTLWEGIQRERPAEHTDVEKPPQRSYGVHLFHGTFAYLKQLLKPRPTEPCCLYKLTACFA